MVHLGNLKTRFPLDFYFYWLYRLQSSEEAPPSKGQQKKLVPVPKGEKTNQTMKRFFGIRANRWDVQELAWKVSMQKFQSMGGFTEDGNINENGRNQR